MKPIYYRVGMLLVFAALILPTPARAIQGFGISPTSQEVTLNPGGQKSGKLTVINDGDTDITYKIYATDYRPSGETYQSVFDDTGKGSNLSAVSWFTLPHGTFVIKSRQEANFAYTLLVPKTAAVGGHYAAVFIQTVPPPSNGAAIINRIDRVGSLFYIAVGGALKHSGNVLPLDVAFLQSNSPVQGAARVHNSGNVHFLAEGSATLASPFGGVGKPVQTRGEVLPGTTRRFEVALPASAPIGLYKLSVTMNYLGKSETQSRWMLLVPKITFIIVSATLLLVLALVFWSLMRRVRR